MALQDDAVTFLQTVAGRGVRFFLEQGRLRSTGAAALTADEREWVRRHKAAIIAQSLSRPQPVAGAGDPAVAPASYQQERLWLLHEIAERSEEYNSVTLLAVRGAFEPARFRVALDRLVAEHPVLRTVFQVRQDVLYQIALDEGPWVDVVSTGSSAQALALARELERVEAGHVFSLTREVPVRCRLVVGPAGDHYIVLNIHHIACDGWSIGLIMDRLSAYYETPDASPAGGSLTYADYARRQRATLVGDVLDTLVGHWEERLRGAPPEHALSVDRYPDESGEHRGGTIRHRLGSAAYARFRDMCLASGGSEFAGLHAVLAVLLARVSGQEETVVGSPIANREQHDTHGTVGFFVNMISVRGAVPATASFREVLAAKAAEIDFGYAFQQVPFEKIVERRTGRHRTGSTPIFQVVLALQNTGTALPKFDGAEVAQLPEVHHHNRFDLEIFVHGEGAGDRDLEWVFDAARFEPATVRRWADWFAALLEEVTLDPGRAVGSLPLPCPEVPATEVPAGRPVDFLARVRAVAAAHPDRVAVSDGVDEETYAGLLANGRRIGSALLASHGPGGVYALDLDRGIDLVRAIVGVVVAGSTYVVLDPEDVAQRRETVLETSRPQGVLAATEVRALADGAAADVDGEASADVEVPAERDLYHVFTSGSTGRPKGVRITYGNLAAYLGGVVPRLRLPEGGTWCWHSSPATDFGNTVIFGALATGGRLEVATRDDILDGPAMAAFLRTRAVDVLKITPSHWEALLETRPVADLVPRSTLILGGEAASRAVVRSLGEVPADVAVFNHYGPSETTVGIFVADLTDRADDRPLPIGHPLPGIRFTIEDDHGVPVPYGVPGELVVSGAQVGNGYLGASEADSPFDHAHGERSYHTGDRVRQRSDGQVVYLGRRDDQVKIRGHRVELGEIKAAIERVPDVARGEVLAVRDSDGRASLVAFVQRAEGGTPAEPAVRPRGADDALATVEQWREFYDFAYSERVSGDVEFNTSGWISSFTGEPIPEPQMRAWLASTIDRISGLRPRSVLEIGCGLGIIAYPLSRSVENYLACDFSATIITANQTNAKALDTGPLTFFTCEAIDIDQHVARIRAAGVDTVVINSVVQYFPDVHYLEAVLDKVLAIDGVRHVFVGDVRNLDLLDEFGLALADARADGPGSAVERARRARVAAEQVDELLVSDLYWREFASTRAAVVGVGVLPRVSRHSNELFDFRYDVVLTKDPEALHTGRSSATVHVTPQDLSELDRLLPELSGGTLDTVVVPGVPNDRTARHCEALRAVRSGVAGAVPDATPGRPAGPTLLETLDEWATRHGVLRDIRYAQDEEGYLSRLDVAFFRAGRAGNAADPAFPARRRGGSRPLAVVPAIEQRTAALIERVTEQIVRDLPVHMRPARLIEVPTFPLNRTGKIDHGQLREFMTQDAEAGALGDLSGETEQRLAGILADLLRPVVPIGRDSDFFALGGHSLLATRYVHAVNREFGTTLRVKAVFDRPVLRDFAELVAGTQASPSPAPAAPAVGTVIPATGLQQRFWTMAQGSGPSNLYNSLLLVELTGPLVPDAVQAAFADVFAHHRVLRSYFDDSGDTLRMRFRDTADFALAEVRVPGLDRAGAERFLLGRLNRPFDLATGPLVEAALLTDTPERHFLAMAVHHAIFDGTSEEIFLHDLEECYAARLAGREPRWADDGRGFLAHAVAAAPVTAQDVEFWTALLADAPPQHSIPLDRDRPARANGSGASFHSILPATTTRLLGDLARRHRTTRFVVLSAVTGLFVSYLSGTDDVVIGSPVDCRETEADNRSIGMYVNTVAFRHRPDWTRPADDLVSAARETFHRAVPHLHVPFDQVVQALNPERIAGVNPVFQINMALQPDGGEQLRFHDCTGRSYKTETVRSKFDLLLNTKQVDDRLHVYWEYDPALFDADRVEQMAVLFERLLHEVASRPERALHQHRIGGTGPGEPALTLLHGPRVPLLDESYLDGFARTVAETPDRPAVRLPDGGGWSYRTLDERSLALAALLRARGVRPGDLVAIALRRSAETLAALIAVNRLGAAYVGLDSDHLRGEMTGLMRDHGIRYAVVEDAVADRLDPATTVRRSELPTSGPVHLELPQVLGTGLAYVIFTSGSTGRPKGVAVGHRSVVNYLTHCATTYLVHRPAVAVMASPMSFDSTVTSTLFAFSTGLTVEILTEGAELEGLRRILADDAAEPRLFKFTPSHLVALENLGGTDAPRRSPHTFVLGGEELKSAVVGTWLEALPNSAFFNEYGPTETTVGCTAQRVTSVSDAGPSLPIGMPICNTTLAVVDRDAICVNGIRGEIVIFGEALARGYLDPEQTRAAFRPLAALDGRLGYFTGDLATMNGTELRWRGRSTREVKLRGFRISLPDIEGAIGGLPSVVDCACDVSADGRSLHAYVVPRGGSSRTGVTGPELRNAIAELLPSYMVPDRVHVRDSFPLTVNGKVDLARLARETAQTPAAETAGGPPPLQRLTAIWREVLTAEGEIPTDVSFFSLGGNSLSITHLLRRLNQEFGVDIALAALYREPTLRGQAALLPGGRTPDGGSAVTVEPATDPPAEIELTAAQQRILLLEKFGSGADYVSSMNFRIEPGADPARLGEALHGLVARHPILAASIDDRGDCALLRPGPGAADDIIEPVLNCRDVAEVEQRAAQARDSAVRLPEGPLFRAFRYLMPDGSLHLQMLVHHVIFDGWSEGILLGDLMALYAGTADDQPPVPFQQYAAAPARAGTEENTAWWIEALTGAPAAHNLPMLDSISEGSPAVRRHRVLGADVAAMVDQQSRRLGVTPFTVVHTALALAICGLSYEDDVVIGVPTANRVDPAFHSTIGLFMETLPMRTRIPGGGSSFEELAGTGRTVVLEALARTDFRIEAVLRACAPHRDGRRNALYQIMLSFNEEGGESLTFGGARAERTHLPARTPKLDLIVDAKVIDGELHLYWEYDSGRFAAATIDALVTHFEEWLHWGLTSPARPIQEFVPAGAVVPETVTSRPVLSAYRRFVDAWTGRTQDIAYTGDGLELSAARLHGAVLAMCGELASRGLGRKSVIACLSPRVLDYVTSFLACSRLGAVHVPLDASAPPSRIAAILEQSEADVVVAADAGAAPGYEVLPVGGEPAEAPVTPAGPVPPTAISHIMYTSGSTGQPKGVRISVAALDAYVRGINDAYGIAGAAVAQCGNPAYDVFVEELALSVLSGNRMVVLSPAERADPSAFARVVDEQRIEMLPLPTSYWAFLVGGMTDADFARLADVRVCAVGGEDYPPAAAATWFDRFPSGPRLFNVYGPTENGPVSTVTELHPDTPPSTLGRPLTEVRCRVRSRFGSTVPVQGRGELYLSGGQLFSGYVGGGPVLEYPTGDVVLIGAEHGFRFVERAGSMMKIAGFRVEPGEYLSVLADVPGVADVRVTADEQRTGVVIYALLDGGAVAPEEIAASVRRRLLASLPPYMRRYELRFCGEIPLTPNGKADFRALSTASWPAPVTTGGDPTTGAGPRAEVREAWQRVLGASVVDDDRGFFDQGGSSMDVLRLLSALGERFPDAFTLIDLYEKPTVALQAEHVHERVAPEAPVESSGPEPDARERLARKRQSRRRARE